MNRMMWLVVIGLSFVASGEAIGQTVGERVGEGLDEAGRAVRRGLQTAGQAVRGGVNTAKTSVYNMEVVNRIYSRLHWDKALVTSTIEAEVRAGGIVVLSGVVPDRAAKLKALTLTADTVGVVQVVDQVAVVAPGTPTAPAAIVPGTKPTVVESNPEIPLELNPVETSPPAAPRR